MTEPKSTDNPTTARRVRVDRRSIIYFLTLLTVMLSVDLVSKWLAFEHVADEPVDVASHSVETPAIGYHDAVVVVPKVFAFKLVLNRGAVFGIAGGARWFFVGICLIATTVIVGIFLRSEPRALRLHTALALILSGALGNMVDRLLYGFVRDMCWLFPDVKLPFGWHWPGSGSDLLYPWIFNVADVALLVGVGLAFLEILITGAKEKRAAATDRK